MTKLYDLVFLGLNPDSPDDPEIVTLKIAQLLDIDADEIEHRVSGNTGKVVKTGLSKNEALLYQAQVVKLGGVCNYRPSSNASSNKSHGKDKSFELAPLEEAQQEFVFTCPACQYRQTVESPEQLPAACPECGVIPSKYDRVATIKQEREKIKQRLLKEQQKREGQAQKLAELQGKEALQQKLENRVRQEIGLPTQAQSRLTGLAIVLWLLLGMVLGGVGASVYYQTRVQPADCQQPPEQPENRP